MHVWGTPGKAQVLPMPVLPSSMPGVLAYPVKVTVTEHVLYNNHSLCNHC